MTQLNNQAADQQPLIRHRHQTEPFWLWVLLVGGSIACHLLLVRIALPTPRLAAASSQAALPIDLVQLPASNSQTSASSKRSGIDTATGTAKLTSPAAAQRILSQNTPSQNTLSQSQITIASHLSKPAKPASTPAASSVAPSVSGRAEPSPVPPAGNSRPQAALPEAAPVNPAAQELPNPESLDQTRLNPETPTTQIPTPASPTPSAPLITTLPIDTAVPDVSGTLPSSSSDSPPLPQVNADRVVVPATLTANLATDPTTSEVVEGAADAIAHPTREVQTFPSDPTTSPCLVTPAAMQFLGATVAMQVSIDEQGKVVKTITRQSSQSPAYDDLAACFVKNWGFEPAIAQGKPVPNDALIVKITINRQ
jgi:TonB family protein